MRITAEQLPRLPRNLTREFKRRQLSTMHAVGKAAVRMLHFQSAHIKDLGTFQTGWRYQAAFTRLDVRNIDPKAVFVERGRRPGKMPPVRALEPWAQRKLGDRRLAWPVARAIGRRGLRPRPVLTRPDVRKGIRSLWTHAMAGLLADATKAAAR